MSVTSTQLKSRTAAGLLLQLS